MKAGKGAEDHMLEQFWQEHLLYFQHHHLDLSNERRVRKYIHSVKILVSLLPSP
jgi:hypothetical protein